MNLHLRSHLNLILFSLITLIYVLPAYKSGVSVNSYSYIKAIAEELRGLAVEANVPIVSATQTTRSGYGSSDVDITDTSESFGLPATADLMFALITLVKWSINPHNTSYCFCSIIVLFFRFLERLPPTGRLSKVSLGLRTPLG